MPKAAWIVLALAAGAAVGHLVAGGAIAGLIARGGMYVALAVVVLVAAHVLIAYRVNVVRRRRP